MTSELSTYNVGHLKYEYLLRLHNLNWYFFWIDNLTCTNNFLKKYICINTICNFYRSTFSIDSYIYSCTICNHHHFINLNFICFNCKILFFIIFYVPITHLLKLFRLFFRFGLLLRFLLLLRLLLSLLLGLLLSFLRLIWW